MTLGSGAGDAMACGIGAIAAFVYWGIDIGGGGGCGVFKGGVLAPARASGRFKAGAVWPFV